MGGKAFGISECKGGGGGGGKMLMPAAVRYGYFLESPILNYKVTNSAILEKYQL